MRELELEALASEIRGVVHAVRHELSHGAAERTDGWVVVSGVLASQLAKELGAGAEPGAVVVGSSVLDEGPEVVIHCIAGAPSDEDAALVRSADRRGVPVVLVQLWPQAEWTQPWVLSPFVVECRAGEGFPLDEIGARVLEAAELDSLLASRMPVLRGPFERLVVSRSMVRAAALAGLAGGRAARPAISLEQVRMLARLVAAEGALPKSGISPAQAVGGMAAAALVTGFALRAMARTAQRALPAPIANVSVAAAGTWAIARAAGALAARVPSSVD